MMELAAFRELVRTNHGAVWQYLRSLGCRRDVADRLTEETFLDVFKAGLPVEFERSTRKRMAAQETVPKRCAHDPEDDVDAEMIPLLRQFFHPEPSGLADRIVARAERLARANSNNS